MSTVNFKGQPVRVDGGFPVSGEPAPGFRLVGGDLSDVTLANYAGKRKVQAFEVGQLLRSRFE